MTLNIHPRIPMQKASALTKALAAVLMAASVLLTGCKVANVKIEEVFKTLLPYFAVTAAILLLVTYVPAISMTIPNVLGLVK